MGRNLRFWLTAPQAAPFDHADAPLALGALLLRAARSDHVGLFAGPGTVGAILARRYDLTALEAAEMLEACARVEAAAPSGSAFAVLLHAAICAAERRAMADCLYQTLLSAGQAAPGDPEIAALVEGVLGVPATDLCPSRRVG